MDRKSWPWKKKSSEKTVAATDSAAAPLAILAGNQGDQVSQKGKIGITLISHWMVPFSASKVNDDAAQRAIDFMLGWFLHPLTYGEYPNSMRSNVGNRLPKFTKKQSKMVKASFDFIGLNYYTANYAHYIPQSNNVPASYNTDTHCNLTGKFR
ncbi:beta-glucosidase 12-like [Magnolia sinica]|uniref:beta-glucosidase 12-like n=1 Tax=Magnolia sinica TaxID=86752 RepID=UPI002658604E|nr:beta-glucosidase 12-like [Magnolia sinica]